MFVGLSGFEPDQFHRVRQYILTEKGSSLEIDIFGELETVKARFFAVVVQLAQKKALDLFIHTELLE